MPHLRKLLILLLFVVASNVVQAQTYKFMATSFSVLEKDQRGKWREWSELEQTSLVISLDTTKNRIVVYSQEIQLYQILEYHDQEENDTNLIYPFTCKNDDGQIFSISIITRKNQGNRKQLYINHPDVILVYNIENMPDPAPTKK